MAIRIQCSSCGRAYEVSDDRAGQTGRCSCGNLTPIPTDATLPPGTGPQTDESAPGPAVVATKKCVCGERTNVDAKVCDRCGRTWDGSVSGRVEAFNWGAFLIPVLWGIGHGLWKWSAAVLLAWGIVFALGRILPIWMVMDGDMSPTAAILLVWFANFAMLALHIYCGTVGGKEAWKSGRYKSETEFANGERQWAWAAAGLVPVLIAMYLAARASW